MVKLIYLHMEWEELASATCSSDTSDSWGCGASCNGDWFQLAWPVSWRGVSISPKELAPNLVAVILWGP